MVALSVHASPDRLCRFLQFLEAYAPHPPPPIHQDPKMLSNRASPDLALLVPTISARGWVCSIELSAARLSSWPTCCAAIYEGLGCAIEQGSLPAALAAAIRSGRGSGVKGGRRPSRSDAKHH